MKPEGSGPRIYNLFPLLAGTTADWQAELPRIAGMNFNWVYLNPFHYPGFSGSLYAVKDYYTLNPLFDDGSGDSCDEQLTAFAEASEQSGLSVMMDLVINHTAKDAVLVENHPDWFLRDEHGELKSLGAIDPDDPGSVTIWGDLAGIDYSERPARAEIIAYWQQLVRHYVGLGFRGFRCDAAYKVPAEVWKSIVAAARDEDARTIFMAETLGCRPEEVYALSDAGFDYLFNSAKWWDFRSSWLLEQYDAFRHIAPSIAFPESHDTERLAAGLLHEGVPEENIQRHYRFHYSFAATFSAGVMLPMGFEFGYRQPLDVVESRPWCKEPPLFDISDFIAETNRIKAAVPALNEDGRQFPVQAPGSDAVVLARHSSVPAEWALLFINPLPGRELRLSMDELELTLDAGTRAEEVTPGGEAVRLRPDSRLVLEPLEVRIFHVRGASGGASGTRPITSHNVTARYLDTVRSGLITIENVCPEIDCGKFPIKREVGDSLEVMATIFREGHDCLNARLLYRRQDETEWREVPMSRINPGLDLWRGTLRLEENTGYFYTIEASTDLFETWWQETGKKLDAAQEIGVELLEGRALVAEALERTAGNDRRQISRALADFDNAAGDDEKTELLRSPLLRSIIARWPDRARSARYGRELEVIVDRVRARFASWYEIFPRSQGVVEGRSATFADCEKRLPEIREMGFDVVYLTPIHPIGHTNRKGRNNTLNAGPDDPGSPYAIGSEEGGHTAIHPELGTLEDFRHFVHTANDMGMDVALDFAIQCSPDHPWLKEYPEWFTMRPDGTIKYAENPPKKYQDIVNVSFYGEHQEELWRELLNVVLFWVQQGVKAFRVDNPHTKPVPFWEWLIREVRLHHPEVIFLSEAFTRPPMVQMLAKVGFSQSYTYFTWRNSKHELTDYLQELTSTEIREYLRPNFFANTPDILPTFLQTGGRPAFKIRFVLAATLSSVYGIYSGFELCENDAVPGKEEYIHSEKYEYKVRDWDAPGNIREYITAINRIRHQNPALQELFNLRFHHADSPDILFYGKTLEEPANLIFVAVNVDPFDGRDATLEFPLEQLGIPEDVGFEVEELLTGVRHLWHGRHHHVRLEPENPAIIFRVIPWNHVDYHSPSL